MNIEDVSSVKYYIELAIAKLDVSIKREIDLRKLNNSTDIDDLNVFFELRDSLEKSLDSIREIENGQTN